MITIPFYLNPIIENKIFIAILLCVCLTRPSTFPHSIDFSITISFFLSLLCSLFFAPHPGSRTGKITITKRFYALLDFGCRRRDETRACAPKTSIELTTKSRRGKPPRTVDFFGSCMLEESSAQCFEMTRRDACEFYLIVRLIFLALVVIVMKYRASLDP